MAHVRRNENKKHSRACPSLQCHAQVEQGRICGKFKMFYNKDRRFECAACGKVY